MLNDAHRCQPALGKADPCCVTIYTKVDIDARPWNHYAEF
tara:strand:- start:2405 stop:2524 length:120 start_codon:yes stop_codon:yes gene_type:complete